MKSVVAIIPTYNEAENIQHLLDLLKKIFAGLPQYRLDVLVVDDSSPDGTGQIVLDNASRNKSVHLLKGKKAGLGVAYTRGFKHVLKHFSPHAVIMMDADLSHDPAAIPSMLRAMEDGADYVIGSRYVLEGTIPGNWPLSRILNSKVANFMAKFLAQFDIGVADLTGGFKVIRGDALKRIDIDEIVATGYVFQVSLLYAFARSGAVLKEVPIHFVDRKFGVSKMRLYDKLEFIYVCYQLNPRSKVQRFVRFASVGAGVAYLSLLALLFVNHLHSSVLISALIAIEVSIVSYFFLNKFYTFLTVQE